mmetsp:Transcript_17069/g.43782  ORF Transcript_17069/g.43782 Transcript_17069/m.43782 type:complete len:212 (+) Transcript_17069:429-1064(+)
MPRFWIWQRNTAMWSVMREVQFTCRPHVSSWQRIKSFCPLSATKRYRYCVGLVSLHQQLPFHYFSPWLSTLKAAALTHLSRAKELIDIIKAQMGNATSPMLRKMLKMTLYFSRDPFASTSKRMSALQSDLGGAVDANLVQSERETKLEVHSCLYNTVFTAEHKAYLADCCCCSVDSALWFEGLDSFGIEFSLDSRLPDNDSTCCLRIRRKD